MKRLSLILVVAATVGLLWMVFGLYGIVAFGLIFFILNKLGKYLVKFTDLDDRY